jgi:outer membrane protein assembly factor BamB
MQSQLASAHRCVPAGTQKSNGWCSVFVSTPGFGPFWFAQALEVGDSCWTHILTLVNLARHIVLCFWLLVSWRANAAVSGADWPMFRGGPALAGVAGGSLPERLALLWTFKTAGPVKSSAAIVQDRVFIGSDDGNVYALALADGTKVWAFKTGGGIESSPLVMEGKVFVGSSDAFLYALEAGTGKLAWKYETGDKILGGPNWVKSGNALRVLVGSYDFKLHCVDAGTGRSNWVYETGNYINGSPAVASGEAIFGGCDGMLHVISLAEGKQAKEIEAGAYIAGSAALVDGRAYFGQYENEFLCVDLKAGTKAWTFHDRNFPYFSSPAVTQEVVVFGGRDKLLHCVKRENGKPVWSFATRGKVDSSPVVCGNKVVVGSDDGRLYVVSLDKGKELWSYEIGQPVESSPAIARAKVVIGADDGNVYCFGGK